MKKKLITRILLTIVFVLGFFAFVCDAQSEEFFSYEPAKVRLTMGSHLLEQLYRGVE